MAPYFITALLASFLITAVLTRLFIPLLKKFAGQIILDIGPRWHKSKQGTPSMGGISFLIAAALTGGVLLTLIWLQKGMQTAYPALVSLIYALLNGLVGVIDDRAKAKKKENEGLKPLQKLLLQTLLAAAYLVILTMADVISTTVYLPFTDTHLQLGPAYYFFALVLLLGVVNCANLTDGVDGLASSVALVIGFFFAMVAVLLDVLPMALPLSVMGGILAGCTAGFLVYNWHPARVFMGDTGSLFLGAMGASMAFMLNMPLLIVIAGLIYVLEGISVIIQVGVYKLTHKRVFKMAPIHHHFEKSGWSEIKVVTVFSLVTLIACTALFFGLYY